MKVSKMGVLRRVLGDILRQAPIYFPIKILNRPNFDNNPTKVDTFLKNGKNFLFFKIKN